MRPPAPPFDSEDAAFDRAPDEDVGEVAEAIDLQAALAHGENNSDDSFDMTVVVNEDHPGELPDGPHTIMRWNYAIPVFFAALEPDALRALVDAFSRADGTFADRSDELVAELTRRYLTPDNAADDT